MNFDKKYLKYKNKYLKLRNQTGGSKCPFNIGDLVMYDGDPIMYDGKNRIIRGKFGTINKLNYNISEGAWYFNPVCNKVNVKFDDKIYENISTLEIIKGDLINYLLTLPQEVECEMLKNLKLHEIINLYNTGNEDLRKTISRCPFDFSEERLAPYKITLREFRTMFPLAYGVNISDSNIIDEEFINYILPRYNDYPNSIFNINNLRNKDIPRDKRPLKINISKCNNLTDRAFAFGETFPDGKNQFSKLIHTLYISSCRNITDIAFTYFRGIHTLNMAYCSQNTITNTAFTNLSGIHTLNMQNCYQRTITDTAFTNLSGIQALNMEECYQITDTAFTNLRGIHTLYMSYCNQPTITDAAFVNLRGIHTLWMRWCNQTTITDTAFTNLRGIQTLKMEYCNQLTITETAISNLVGIYKLETLGCRKAVRDAADKLMGRISPP
jgi:hypothetical protein